MDQQVGQQRELPLAADVDGRVALAQLDRPEDRVPELRRRGVGRAARLSDNPPGADVIFRSA